MNDGAVSYTHLLADKAGSAEELAVKVAEGEEILKRLRDNMYVVTLEVKGDVYKRQHMTGGF